MALWTDKYDLQGKLFLIAEVPNVYSYPECLMHSEHMANFTDWYSLGRWLKM